MSEFSSAMSPFFGHKAGGSLNTSTRTPPAKKGGMLGWISEFRALPDEFVLHHQSLDQYLYLRFMKMITVMCAVGCVITWYVKFVAAEISRAIAEHEPTDDLRH